MVAIATAGAAAVAVAADAVARGAAAPATAAVAIVASLPHGGWSRCSTSSDVAIAAAEVEPKRVGAPHSGRAMEQTWSLRRGRKMSFHTSE